MRPSDYEKDCYNIATDRKIGRRVEDASLKLAGIFFSKAVLTIEQILEAP